MAHRLRWRTIVGFALILWGSISFSAYFWPLLPWLPKKLWIIISAVVLLLPGGVWSIVLGFAFIAYDIPSVRLFNEWLGAKIKEKFPRIYRKFIEPLDAVKNRWAVKLKAWFAD